MVLSDLLVFFFFAFIAILIWKHLDITRHAEQLASKYCAHRELVLLDQSIILKSIRPRASPTSLVQIERNYAFEFSSIGDKRYTGLITMHGGRCRRIELEPFKMPEDEQL